MAIPDHLLLELWTFVRGDTDPGAFEKWLYSETTLETVLGHSLYMAAVETDFGNRESVFQLKRQLSTFAQTHDQSNCLCVRYPDLTVFTMGHHKDFIASLETTRRRGESHWWLHTEECQSCGQSWLMASEERVNDVYILRRLRPRESEAIRVESRWPPDFDRYETLLEIGRDAGLQWTFVDPLNSSLVHTARDLARERPQIGEYELASLLNVDPDMAKALVREGRRPRWMFRRALVSWIHRLWWKGMP